MSITRRALLIDNPGETGDENYCKGVYVDIENYKQFLTSPEGGAWDPNHIHVLDRPSVQDVRFWVADVTLHDFGFIMFTGHGWFSNIDNDRILVLRKGQEIASNELLKGLAGTNKKRTVVLDCCQKRYNESLLEKRAHGIMVMNASMGRVPDREACRKLFLKNVQDAEPGFVRMCSCQKGELSRDDDSTGGYYNSNLISGAESWALAQAKNSWVKDAVLSVIEAHEIARVATQKKSAGLQNPEMEKARTGPYFPFAVFA